MTPKQIERVIELVKKSARDSTYYALSLQAFPAPVFYGKWIRQAIKQVTTKKRKIKR